MSSNTAISMLTAMKPTPMAISSIMAGFAVLAYPVKYGVSGVMTFLVNHDGVIWERDLGPETSKRAEALQRFNPGKGWRQAQQ